MKKLSAILMALFLGTPSLTLAADSPPTPDDQALVAASYQQGEDVDRSPPVVQSATPAAPPTEPARTVAAESDNTLAKAVTDLATQTIALQTRMNQLQHQADATDKRLIQLDYFIYGLAALSLVLVLSLLMQRKKNPKTEKNSKSEYDFMASAEGIPAKLDLARAYIAMEDYTAARETLNEILKEGAEQHRAEAKALLNKIQ